MYPRRVAKAGYDETNVIMLKRVDGWRQREEPAAGGGGLDAAVGR